MSENREPKNEAETMALTAIFISVTILFFLIRIFYS